MESLIEIVGGSPIAQELADTTAALAPITVVQNDADARRAKNAVKAVKNVVKAISTARLDATRKADAWKKRIIEEEREFTAAANAEIARVDGLVGEYVTAKAKAEEEARLAAEAARAAELRQAQLEAEAEAALTGNAVAVPVPVPDESEQKRGPIVQGVTARTVWTFEIVNPDLVPRAYCVPDEKAIREYMNSVRSSGADIDALKIPGVAFRKEIRV